MITRGSSGLATTSSAVSLGARIESPLRHGWWLRVIVRSRRELLPASGRIMALLWRDPAVHGWLHVLGTSSAATAAGPAAGKDREEEDCADSGTYTNNDVSVLISPHVSLSVAGREGKRHKYPVDPALHFSERARSRTVPILARAITPAWSAVQEVLLHPEAGIRAKFGRLASEDAVRIVARPGVVVG